jgi:hypothetical protein
MGGVPLFVPETDESKLQVGFGLFHIQLLCYPELAFNILP